MTEQIDPFFDELDFRYDNKIINIYAIGTRCSHLKRNDMLFLCQRDTDNDNQNAFSQKVFF